MPKRKEIMESKINNDTSKNYIDSDWLELKQEYDEATKNIKEREKSILKKEKDDFAEMWCAAGLELKETLELRRISSCGKKRN